ncbi:hypothetical protein GCM10017044_01930 [Kordiimonas sediminis]|uniref:DUF3426 domain-containing protein n=2 Tax=Kordiimonas sediminis TaxID=1735581 RepID=A0A919AJM8_9PROT|nr:hypothetical protein GCM10017044_01930 [Kordiimonas sediminis]
MPKLSVLESVEERDEALAAAAREILGRDEQGAAEPVDGQMAAGTVTPLAEAEKPSGDASNANTSSENGDVFTREEHEDTGDEAPGEASGAEHGQSDSSADSADDTAPSGGDAEQDISVGAALKDGDELDNFDEDALEEEDFLSRRRAEQRRLHERGRLRRRRILASVLGLLLLALWVGIGAVFALYKDQVKEVWPASRMIYAYFEGMNDAESLKKEFEEAGETLSPSVVEEPTNVVALVTGSRVVVEDKRRVLEIYGYVENKGRMGAKVPKVQANILDGNGKIIDSWKFDPPGLLIARGKKLKFKEIRFPIPRGASSATVEVVEGQYSERPGTHPDEREN